MVTNLQFLDAILKLLLVGIILFIVIRDIKALMKSFKKSNKGFMQWLKEL